MMMIIIQPCFPSSWDNGDTEKMSPWDMEPIPDDGRNLKCGAHLKNNKELIPSVLTGYSCDSFVLMSLQPRFQMSWARVFRSSRRSRRSCCTFPWTVNGAAAHAPRSANASSKPSTSSARSVWCHEAPVNISHVSGDMKFRREGAFLVR